KASPRRAAADRRHAGDRARRGGSAPRRRVRRRVPRPDASRLTSPGSPMPEGDTIHRIAARLRATLGSGPLSSLEVVPQVRGPRPAGGESIDAIEARGKHLLISFGGGATLHTHLGMDGTWRVTTPAA